MAALPKDQYSLFKAYFKAQNLDNNGAGYQTCYFNTIWIGGREMGSLQGTMVLFSITIGVIFSLQL